MAGGTFTIRIDPEKEKLLESLAETFDRSRNYLVNQAIDDYLSTHAWQIEETKKAIEEADAGDFASDEEMVAIETMFARK